MQEPRFASVTGRQARAVLPGNKDFVVGDLIRKPEGGGGGGGPKGSPDGEGEDDFVFTLTRDEFLDIFFEDLELAQPRQDQAEEPVGARARRAGFTTDGSPSKLNRVRTMRNSLARRIALRRPKLAEVEMLEAQIAEEEAQHIRARSVSRHSGRGLPA